MISDTGGAGADRAQLGAARLEAGGRREVSRAGRSQREAEAGAIFSFL